MSTTVNSAAATGTTYTGAATPAISKDGTEDRFLKLLIAQMKNQDPLNPMDNAQVTSQMAQINTVQGIAQLNSSITTMLAQLQGGQAIALTGHDVLVDGNSLNLAANGSALAARGGFDLSQDADKVSVAVKDDKGNVVAQLDLGAQTAGPGAFAWDGKTASGATAPAGKYTFDVKAWTGTAAAPVSALAAGHVSGTAVTAQGVRLTLDGLGSRYYSDVRMVL